MISRIDGKEKLLYLDSNQPVDVRVQDLLGRMTLEEKTSQTIFVRGRRLLKNERFSAIKAGELLGEKGIGGVIDPWLPGRTTARIVNAVQKYLVKKTRLGIPAFISGECLHGHLSPGATIFPQSIGLSCSWNPDLVEKVAAAAAREATAVGVRQALSPDLDLARDPRWGRVEETYGEDTYLVSRLGVAYIRGLQGRQHRIGRDKMVATAKHFAAHCAPQGGLNIAPSDVGMRKMREEYLPTFKAAIKAGVLSIMPAYSEVDGVPCTNSKFLLQQILREEWGFEGFVFSDFHGINFLATIHKTAENLSQAGKQAFEAGVDVEAPDESCFGRNLLRLVKKGEISKKRLDDAVGRILRAKILAGLFENSFADETKIDEIVHCDKHVKLTRKAAGESIVLLRNEGDLLPLDKGISSIAVIGPNADMAECGNYCVPKTQDVSPLDGIRRAVSRKTRVIHAPGCDMHDLSKDGFDEAVRAAASVDVAVLCVGGSSMSHGGVGWTIGGKKTRIPTCGEGYDRTNLNLSGVQQELVEAVVATGTPTVVILINGRPLSVSWIAEHVPAILEAWYPGEQGGEAIADILFGKVNPSGRLTVSIPRSAGQVPKYYSQKPSAGGIFNQPGALGKPGRDYVHSNPSPLYDFGFGLSYTTFRYSNLQVSPAKIIPNGKVKVSLNVRNTGRRKGREVVQLYLNDIVSSVTTAVKLLKGFKSVRLRPGEIKTVCFELGPDELCLINKDMQHVVEPGVFEVTAGTLKKRFEVR